MKKIAITGNIASGKTIVENYFKELGYKTLCLDDVTSKLYENLHFKKELIKLFNTTDKKEISGLVFSDKTKLKALEALILPLIKEKMFEFFNENNNEKIVFVAAPTLFEAGYEIYFDEIIFVSSNENLRLERLIKRNNLSQNEALNKINSQIKEEFKIKKCSKILTNNSTKEEFLNQIIKLKEELSTL